VRNRKPPVDGEGEHPVSPVLKRQAEGKAEQRRPAMALFERRARRGDREVVYRDQRGPVRRVLGAITSFIGWIVLLIAALIVLLILIF
jgi:hypothetical protein